jgi:hypothetical protein
MFNHKSEPDSSPTEATTSSRDPFRKRLSAAFKVLVHGERPTLAAKPLLDPLIVASIHHHADFIADTYDNPVAGSFARDILADSAYVIVDSFGVAPDETAREPVEAETTADMLAQAHRGSR